VTSARISRLLPLLASAVLLLAAAPAARAATVTAEAETFSLPSGSGQVIGDASASAGRALEIWSNAAATGTVTAQATSSITVRARGQLCSGAPHMVVSVDGRVALDTDVAATSWSDYSAALALADGAHTVSVRFTNDYLRHNCDRNLFVDRVQLISTTGPRPLPSAPLYVDPNTGAAAQAAAWRTSDPTDAALLDKIATEPQAAWFGDWSGDVTSAVNTYVSAAGAKGALPQLVAYDIPERDCGSYSSGGATSADAYRSWIRAFAAGIGSRAAIVVLEPDALAGLDCLSAADQQTRYALLADAVHVLAANPGTYVYIDAGHDAWQPAATMAARLQQADVAEAQGFALNVSNFRAQAGLVSYGQAISQATGGAHFVIDTSRNGLGPAPDGSWCNPPGRALGARPGTTADAGLDYDLWVKRPGESDGTCNGGPAAGVFWPDYALGLAQRAAY
jgi:endoglucanase